MTINLPLGNLGDGLKNPHVSVPGAIALSGELVRLWNPAWYTAHEQAIQGTQKLLFVYLGLQAAGTIPRATQDSVSNLQTQVNQIKSTTMNVTKALAILIVIPAMLLLTTGCAALNPVTKTTTVVGGVTNTVATVNEGALTLDATGVQVATAIAVNTVLVETKNDLNVIASLKNAKTAIDGILNGVNTSTAQQVITMLKLQGNAALSSQVDTLLQAISSAEQALIQKYGSTSVAGEITVTLLKAVDTGLGTGLAGH